MDYFDLLHQAQKNNKNFASKEVRCYSTVFSPPKKLVKSNVSGENIKKFLARKEEEEKQRILLENKKKEELQALRALDKKAHKRVKVMLKRTKSANKSVMADAIDNVNTADTLAGPQMCDDDDFGYVSQEASALYEKLMSKYQLIPVEKSKKIKREVKDINATKDRVKAALKREEEEELNPQRKRKRKSENVNRKDATKDTEGKNPTPKRKLDKKESKSVKKRRSAPPSVDFFQLLKIAEQKQHEPIIIEKEVTSENESPMTMKQKLEQQKEIERKNGKKPISGSLNLSDQVTHRILAGSIPDKNMFKKESISNLNNEKLSIEMSKADHRKTTEKVSSTSKDENLKPCNIKRKNINDKFCSVSNEKENSKADYNNLCGIKSSSINGSKNNINPERTTNVKCTILKKNNQNKMSDIDKEIEMLLKKKALLMQKANLQLAQSDLKKKNEKDNKPKKQFHEEDIVSKKVVTHNTSNRLLLQTKAVNDLISKKGFSPVNGKAQVKVRSGQTKTKTVLKRVIDSESEHDSELDDFIDDGPEEEMDYSRHIKEIFGYDKSKYEDTDEGECEVASFHTQMIEEKRCAKIGLLEDLADIKREKEEKARAIMRKKQLAKT